jgi:hypothetical protein
LQRACHSGLLALLGHAAVPAHFCVHFCSLPENLPYWWYCCYVFVFLILLLYRLCAMQAKVNFFPGNFSEYEAFMQKHGKLEV